MIPNSDDVLLFKKRKTDVDSSVLDMHKRDTIRASLELPVWTFSMSLYEHDEDNWVTDQKKVHSVPSDFIPHQYQYVNIKTTVIYWLYDTYSVLPTALDAAYDEYRHMNLSLGIHSQFTTDTTTRSSNILIDTIYRNSTFVLSNRAKDASTIPNPSGKNIELMVTNAFTNTNEFYCANALTPYWAINSNLTIKSYKIVCKFTPVQFG